MIAIVGGGSHGLDIAAICEASGVEYEFYDDDEDRGKPVEDIEMGARYIAGVNHPRTRALLSIRLHLSAAPPLVHPSAIVGPGCVLSPGVVVAPNVVLLRDVILGPHVHVNYGSTMTRTNVGAFTTIAPGVDIAGDVKIGPECFIGIGAKVANLVTIGEAATIGAGAVVLDDVPAGELAVGVPARVKAGIS